ncbi:MAG: hypothetical protein RLP15_11280 [Cryomorphaceae bacterium]
MNTELLKNATHIATLNNPESVVEIYLDQQASRVIEVKSLSNNRYKTYRFEIAAYLDRVIGYKGVDIKLKAHLNR